MITGATLIGYHVQNSYSAKELLAEICPSAVMVSMPVNQVDTAFENAVIFCLLDKFLGQSTAQGAQLLYDYAFKQSY